MRAAAREIGLGAPDAAATSAPSSPTAFPHPALRATFSPNVRRGCCSPASCGVRRAC